MSRVKIKDAPFSFNRSIRIGSRRERITGDSGALTGCELPRRSKVLRFLAKRLPDERNGRRIRHSQGRPGADAVAVAGQGRREHSDGTELRDDPALRLATSDRAGWKFVLELLEWAERHLCGYAAVRFDAGYPGEPLMAALEERGTHYVTRVRNNAVLKRLALRAMDAVVWDALRNGAPAGGKPRTWVCESSYRAGVVVPFPPGRAGRR